MLAREGKYNDCLFHRLIPGFMVSSTHLLCPALLIQCRSKQETRQALGPEVNRTGEHLSETSMMLKMLLPMIPEVL
jgi:cyclophilin family peptidyl-prolyl cis-trans isomerase